MTEFLVFVPVGYLLGSLPFGLITGRMTTGVDIREHGSGSTGMTNVLRTIGRPAAALVLLLDMSKAVLAVMLAKLLLDSPGVEAAAGLAAIVGHNWPVFTGFRGGRGTAAGWGGLIALSPLSALIATVTGAAALAVSRYVSLGSLSGGVSGGVALVVLSIADFEPLAYAWFGAIGALLIVIRHRDNIGRLMKGDEHKLGQPAGNDETEGKTDRSRRTRWPRSA